MARPAPTMTGVALAEPNAGRGRVGAMSHNRLCNALSVVTAILRAGRRWGAVALLLLSCTTPTLAQDAPAAQKETPPKVRELLDLLADPAVRDWIQRQHAAAQAAAPAAAPDTTTSGYMADRVARI